MKVSTVWIGFLLLCGVLPDVRAQSLNAPESVEFHPRSGRTLVSNQAAGEILWRATNGALSTFTSDPTSPYGIELLHGVLYAVDSGHLKGYDIDTSVKVLDVTIAGASFLNGITSDGDHRLYLTDFSAKKLIRVDVADLLNPVQTPLATLTQTPNGVVFDRAVNRLLISTWGSAPAVLSYDIAAATAPGVLVNVTGYSNIDGITLGCNGSLFLTPWTCVGGGCLIRIDPPFSLTSSASVVAPGLNKPADIDFSNRSGEVAIPQAVSGAGQVTLVASGCEAALFTDDFER
ncbi:MAG: hypothetical protein ABI411_06250 [Tahibacter sp.]